MFYDQQMRRQHPDLVHEARRIGLRNRMRDEWRLSEAHADALIERWVAEAERREMARDDSYWREGERWLREAAQS
jgi:hypothetical protein